MGGYALFPQQWYHLKHPGTGKLASGGALGAAIAHKEREPQKSSNLPRKRDSNGSLVLEFAKPSSGLQPRFRWYQWELVRCKAQGHILFLYTDKQHDNKGGEQSGKGR